MVSGKNHIVSSNYSSVEIELVIKGEAKLLENVMNSSSPENEDKAFMFMKGNELHFKCNIDKISSIYGLVDEILKSYELVKKLTGQDYS